MAIQRKVLFVDITSADWKANPAKYFHQKAEKFLKSGDSNLYGLAFVVNDVVYGFRAQMQNLGQRKSQYAISSIAPQELTCWPFVKGAPANQVELFSMDKGVFRCGEQGEKISSHFHDSADFNAVHHEGSEAIRMKTLKRPSSLSYLSPW